jgi:hypothetical protein
MQQEQTLNQLQENIENLNRQITDCKNIIFE